jgi:hypothetical protein
VTTIPEKKGATGFIFGFLAVVFGLAAVRGAQGAPILAAAAAIGAVALVAYLVTWYRRPAPMLSISPDEIWYGRLDQPGQRIERDTSGSARLEFREGFRHSGWFLGLAGDPETPGILMTGFDMQQVAAACRAQGWTFGDASDPVS